MLWNLIQFFMRNKHFDWVMYVIASNLSSLQIFFVTDVDCLFDCYLFIMQIKNWKPTAQFGKLTESILSSGHFKSYMTNNSAYTRETLS